jgi:hypothetical protein
MDEAFLATRAITLSSVRRLALTGLAMFGIAGGCKPDHETDKPVQPDAVHFTAPQGDVDIREWDAALANATCARLERCPSTQLVAGYYENEPCVEFFTHAYPQRVNVLADVHVGRLNWNAKNFGTCLRKWVAASCQDQAADWESCLENTLRLPVGAECTESADCAHDLWCNYNVEPFVCAAQVAEGESCQSDESCQKGQICNATSAADYACVKALQEGEACNSDPHVNSNCMRTLVCVAKTEAQQATCQLPVQPAVEEACSLEDSVDECPASSVCMTDDERQLCTPLADVGDECRREDNLERGSNCLAVAYCAASEDGSQGTCRARIASGQKCDARVPHTCALGLECDASSATCKAWQHKDGGAACEGPADCYSGSCDGLLRICRDRVNHG